MINNDFCLYASITAIVAVLAATPQTGSAQTLAPLQVPLADTQCNGIGINRLSNCVVTGDRTSTQPVVTAAPLPGSPTLSLVTQSEQVTYDGRFVIGGAAVSTVPGNSFGIFPAQTVISSDGIRVEGSLAYTGSVSSLVPNASVAGALATPRTALGQFLQYDIHELDVRKIGVDVKNYELSLNNGAEYTFSLSSANPTAITDNSTALTGNFHGTNADGAVVFGSISGTASVIAAAPNRNVVTPSPIFPNSDGTPSAVYLSPLALQYNVTSQETTRLDESGLVTPTIAVTEGINMNASRITNLGAAINGTDAVNLAQVTQLIASGGPVQDSEGTGALAGGTGSSASGNGAVALGQGQQASGNGAVAIGDPNIATGTGAIAIGADNTAIGRGAIALGDRNAASGVGAVAIGSESTAAAIGTVAIGLNAEATGTAASAVGTNTVASATGSTALGYASAASERNTLAVGYRSEAGATNATAVGAFATATAVNSSAIGRDSVATAANSVALGQGSVADQANTVSVGSADSERRVVNVANGLAATDAINKAQLDAETAKRKTAEALLATNITTEAATRASADTSLQNAINAEVATRASAVASVRTGLSNEAATRLAADNAEANARAAADNSLQLQINSLGSSIFSLSGRVTTLESTVKQDRKDARQGIAAAVAMTPAPMPSAPGKVAYTVNVANFRDEQAVAASLAMRLRGPNPLAVTAGVSYGGGANTAMRVGVAGEF